MKRFLELVLLVICFLFLISAFGWIGYACTDRVSAESLFLTCVSLCVWGFVVILTICTGYHAVRSKWHHLQR